MGGSLRKLSLYSYSPLKTALFHAVAEIPTLAARPLLYIVTAFLSLLLHRSFNHSLHTCPGQSVLGTTLDEDQILGLGNCTKFPFKQQYLGFKHRCATNFRKTGKEKNNCRWR